MPFTFFNKQILIPHLSHVHCLLHSTCTLMSASNKVRQSELVSERRIKCGEELLWKADIHTACVYTHILIYYIYRYTHTCSSPFYFTVLSSFAHSIFPWQIKSHSAAWHTIQRNPFNFQTPTADPFSVFLCKEGLRFWIVTITLYSPIISFLLYRWYLRSQRDTDNW